MFVLPTVFLPIRAREATDLREQMQYVCFSIILKGKTK